MHLTSPVFCKSLTIGHATRLHLAGAEARAPATLLPAARSVAPLCCLPPQPANTLHRRTTNFPTTRPATVNTPYLASRQAKVQPGCTRGDPHSIDMNQKNWNDRADKDLFFTILSVKNIGVISGGEWTTIGNHMRSLGYGFTNEGCRYVRLTRAF